MTHICVGKSTIIASDNGLSPGRRQAIIWTNAGILLIGPLGTKFNEILIEIHTFSFKKMHLKISSAKWRPFCLGPNVLNCLRIVALRAPLLKKMRYAYIRHRVHKSLTLYISVIQWWNCRYSIVKINNSFWDPITGLYFQKKYDFLIDKRWQKPLDTQSCCSLYMAPQCYVTSQ